MDVINKGSKLIDNIVEKQHSHILKMNKSPNVVLLGLRQYGIIQTYFKETTRLSDGTSYINDITKIIGLNVIEVCKKDYLEVGCILKEEDK